MRVLTIGTFDLLHQGHINLFRRCRKFAGQWGRVHVGVNTDEFVERCKGATPEWSLERRMNAVEAVGGVDAVWVNWGDESCVPLVEDVDPDVLIVGSDWATRDYHSQTGLSQQWLDERGIALCFVPRTPGVSSTQLRRRGYGF